MAELETYEFRESRRVLAVIFGTIATMMLLGIVAAAVGGLSHAIVGCVVLGVPAVVFSLVAAKCWSPVEVTASAQGVTIPRVLAGTKYIPWIRVERFVTKKETVGIADPSGDVLELPFLGSNDVYVLFVSGRHRKLRGLTGEGRHSWEEVGRVVDWLNEMCSRHGAQAPARPNTARRPIR